MKTKKYHFGKRWAVRDVDGLWLTTRLNYWDKDIIEATVYKTKRSAQQMARGVSPTRGAEVVCIKETVYVVEVTPNSITPKGEK